MLLEEFRDIPGYEGLYQVSNLGRIKSLRGDAEKILSPIKIGDGYCVKLCNDGLERRYMIHHLVANVFIPNPDKARWLIHKDGDKRNNNVDNLEWRKHKKDKRGSNIMTKEELEIMEDVLNEEILSYLQNGYGTNNDMVIIMRGMLKRHGLKEYYRFDDYGESDE